MELFYTLLLFGLVRMIWVRTTLKRPVDAGTENIRSRRRQRQRTLISPECYPENDPIVLRSEGER